VKGDTVSVSFDGEKEPRVTRAMRADGRPADHVAALTVEAPVGAKPGAPRFVLKPIAPARLRVEMFSDPGTGARGAYHEEVFKKQ
jgi:hypothetical protein